MNMILKIAKKELQLLFYSPIAWFLLLLFIIQTAWNFTGIFSGYVSGSPVGRFAPMASYMIFQNNAFWATVMPTLYYYIPLLTMGLISRELGSGSIKLLYSSPVSNRQIVLGKFFAMVGFALVISAILFVYVAIAWSAVENFDLDAILCGLLGIFLVICTYSAIGIYVSSLSSYQFVAALGTFIILGILSSIWGLWQEYDVIRDVTYWLTISGRAWTFLSGMLCSEDVLYFPIVTTLFLALTIIRLNAVRQKIRFSVTLYRNVGVILLACCLGYLSSRPKLKVYCDLTSSQMNTIFPVTQDIVAQLEGGLSITAYANVLAPDHGAASFPRFMMINRSIFEKYIRFKPETELKVCYYYDTITALDNPIGAKVLADQMEKHGSANLHEEFRRVCKLNRIDSSRVKSPEEIRAMVDLTGERTFVWEILRENGQRAWLRMYHNSPSPYPRDGEVPNIMKKLVMEYPKVGFAVGHGMRSITDADPQGYYTFAGYKHYREGLDNQGFGVKEVDLEKGVSEEISILTIADPREAFTEKEKMALQQYIDRGDNLFILCEPRRRELMNPLLREMLGVELTPGTLVQYRNDKLLPEEVRCLLTPEAKEFNHLFKQADYFTISAGTGIEQVEDKGFRLVPLLMTDTIVAEAKVKQNRSYAVWNEMESLNYENAPLSYNPQAGEVAQTYYPSVVLERTVRGKEQRIVVMGDADCISNNSLKQSQTGGNFLLFLGTYCYLSDNEMPVKIDMVAPDDNRVFLKPMVFVVLRYGLLYVIPLLLAGLGLFFWFRRRGR